MNIHILFLWGLRILAISTDASLSSKGNMNFTSNHLDLQGTFYELADWV